MTIPGKIRIRIPLKVWLYKRGRGGEPVKKKKTERKGEKTKEIIQKRRREN
jgi:hypothetical protein